MLFRKPESVMKKICFFLIVILLPLAAQNPDGKNASIHVTPSWLWGTADFQRVTSVWYPPTQASDAQVVQSTDWGTIDHPYAFGISTMMKIPATSFLTLSLSYAFRQEFEEYGRWNPKLPYYSQFWSASGKMHAVSFTMSVYNLFSVYQE